MSVEGLNQHNIDNILRQLVEHNRRYIFSVISKVSNFDLFYIFSLFYIGYEK